MADDDAEVVTWQKRLEKVEAALAKILKPESDPAGDPPKGSPPEPVDPPKDDVKPPAKPDPEAPPPKPARGLLHKAIFG